MRSSDTHGTADKALAEPSAGALQVARAEGLRYVNDNEPGIRRLRRGRGFKYVNPDGKPVRDPEDLARIRSLAIPPAYTDVWICARPNGHIQATGRDARGRKQYRYHARWREHRDSAKFDRMLEFGHLLPKVRRRVAQHLRLPGLPREKVLATIVRLLEHTLVRVGNEEYVRQNGSFGLTTLRNRHVDIKGETLRFEFRGKSGIVHRVSISDPHLARIVGHCQDLPGQELFQWIDDDGERHGIDSTDVNDYLREATGSDFTAKDFRTWFATVEALRILRACKHTTQREAKGNIKECIAAVSKRLGNTPAICRKCYVHPAVLAAYLDGTMAKLNGTTQPVRCMRQLLRAAAKTARSSEQSYNNLRTRQGKRRVVPTVRRQARTHDVQRSDRA